MKNLRLLLGSFIAFVLGLLPLQAQTSTFDTLTDVTDEASIYFGVIVALAVLVTGFFLGRKWLKSI